MNDLLAELEDSRQNGQFSESNAGQANSLKDLIAKEGGQNLSETIGLHLKDGFHVSPESQEYMKAQDQERAHKRPVDLHGWDLDSHLDSRERGTYSKAKYDYHTGSSDKHGESSNLYDAHGIPLHHATQEKPSSRKPYLSEFHGIPKVEHNNHFYENEAAPK